MVKYAKCSGLDLWLFSITSTLVCPLKSLADTLDLIVWGGDGGVPNWAIGIDMYTLMCIKLMPNKNLLYKKNKKQETKKTNRKNQYIVQHLYMYINIFTYICIYTYIYDPLLRDKECQQKHMQPDVRIIIHGL